MRLLLSVLVLSLALSLFAGSLPAQTEGQQPTSPELKKHSFEGYIEWMPQYGYVGEWVVTGHRLSVTSRTEINTRYGPPSVGAYVHVYAVEYRGQLVATKIRVKKPM